MVVAGFPVTDRRSQSVPVVDMEGIGKGSGAVKAIAGFLAVATVVAVLYKLKADQTYLSSPIGTSWKWGTSNQELMAAIEANDAARMKSLLPAVPRQQMRRDFVLSLARDDRKECLAVALDAGWSPDGGKSDGGPLLSAIRSGQLDAAKILLDHHARLDVTSYSQSLLGLAVAAKRKPVEALELLRHYGAKMEHHNLLTPAIEVDNLDVARLLIERYGANPQDGLSEAFGRTWVEPGKEA
ncbi:MAG TPA: hypothetical protein VG820_08865, partial [Fimbriimonadaceae bacterium]|nr:hypothetical protein [Fimbriimonadaceae bacterium]